MWLNLPYFEGKAPHPKEIQFPAVHTPEVIYLTVYEVHRIPNINSSSKRQALEKPVLL